MTERTAKRVNGTAPHAPAAITGRGTRRGFKAELADLRKRMRAFGFTHEDMAAEISRRYRLRPREAYRLAHGWTLEKAAELFNARATEIGADPDGRAPLLANRLGEYERWPATDRKPSPYALCVMADIYQTDVLSLLDLSDHENLPARDRLVLMRHSWNADGRPASPIEASATAHGISVSMPYIPGRLVIELFSPGSTDPQSNDTQPAKVVKLKRNTAKPP